MRSSGLVLTIFAGFATAAVVSAALTPGWAGAASSAAKTCPYSSASPAPAPGSKCPYAGSGVSGNDAPSSEGPKCPVSGETARPSVRPAPPVPVRIDRT